MSVPLKPADAAGLQGADRNGEAFDSACFPQCLPDGAIPAPASGL